MDLTRIRKNIDDLDTMIVTLLAKRSDLVTAAGRLRKNERAACDPKRVNQVLRNVRERAAGKGLDPAVAEEVYRTIMRCLLNKELEECEAASRAGRGEPCR